MGGKTVDDAPAGERQSRAALTEEAGLPEV
jgi:hypothetical protein